MTEAETLEKLIPVLKALAEPNRLRILAVLMEGASCNCELGDRLGLAPSLLSHHLRVLREAGLVTDRRDAVDGRWVYYAVDREFVTQIRQRLDWLLDVTRMPDRVVVCGPEGFVEAYYSDPERDEGILEAAVTGNGS